MMAPIFDKLPDSDEALASVFDELDSKGLDFVIACGDLVHEGTSDDYARLKKLADEHLARTPLYVCLGNHDRKAAFYEGFLGEQGASDKPYYYAAEIQGLRIIALDSACSGGEAGAFAEEELDWLADVLQTPAKQGTVLFYHHPIAWGIEQMAMQAPAALENALENSDVLAIFDGHTHMNDIRHVCNVPQVTADSTLFGCRFTPEKLVFTDEAGYNLCSLDESGLSVRSVPLYPKPCEVTSVDIAAIMQALNPDQKKGR